MRRAGKAVKLIAVAFSIIISLLGALYVLSPYLIKSRFGETGVVASPARYGGLEGLPEGGRILFVTAHPDDLEFMAGGTLPKLLARDNRVYLVLLTDGGKQRYMPAFYSRRIVKTRHDEQLKIAGVEGLSGVFFIDYPDGGLADVDMDEAAAKVAAVARKIDATDIFTFESGRREGYYDPDHDAAGRIGTSVAKESEAIRGLYYFRAAEPNLVVDITDTFEKKMDILFMFTEFRYKRRTLRAMHEAWAASDGKRIGVRYAESFYAQRLRAPAEASAGDAVRGERAN